MHPHDAKTCNGHTINELEKIAKNECVVAIGECGLDYNRNFSPQDIQKKWFEAQVELAERLDMGLFLHEREAHEDLYNILKKHEGIAEKAVVHCFTGTKQEAQNYADLGCYIGVTGWICDMKRGRDLQEAVSAIPPEKLMIETKNLKKIEMNQNIYHISSKQLHFAWALMLKNLQSKLLKILKNFLKYKKEMKKCQ